MRQLLLSRVSGSSQCVLGLSVGLLVVVTGFLATLCAPAFAEFSRPFIPALTIEGTPTGPSGEEVPFGELGCIAVDTGEGGNSSGNIWVGNIANSFIDELSSSSGFLGQLSGAPTRSCTFDHSNKELYTAGPEEWVAVDNSTGSDTGDKYTAVQGLGTVIGTVTRNKPNEEPANFTCSGPGAGMYIRNGNELIGRPLENGEVENWRGQSLAGVAVDSGSGSRSVFGGSVGNIYVINNKSTTESGGLEVDEFTPEGCFIAAINGIVKVKRGGKEEIEELFKDGLEGVAVDPTDGDILVAAPSFSRDQAIDEFTPSGEYLGKITGTSPKNQFGEKGLLSPEGMAVSAEGDLYADALEVKENENGEVVSVRYVVDVFGRGAFYPEVVTGGVSGVQGSEATLSGRVDDEGRGLSECYFEVVSEEQFKEKGFSELKPGQVIECSKPDAGEVPVDSDNHGVHGVARGLVSGVVYRYRLVAATALGDRGGVREGEVESFAAPGVPVVGGVSVGGVSSSFAEFSAVVDPVGLATSYYFEYVGGDGVVGVTPVVGVGSGDRGVGVVWGVGGLLPGMGYRVRVVARNALGVTVGSFVSFVTLSEVVPGLPDGRGYELLTPADKGDAEDLFGGSGGVNDDLGYSSGDGDGFLLWTTAAFGSFPTSGEDLFGFRRSAVSGWSASSVAVRGLGAQSVVSAVFDPADFSVVGVDERYGSGLSLGADLVGPVGGPYTSVGSAGGSVATVGASSSGKDVVLEGPPDSLLLFCESALQHAVKVQEEEEARKVREAVVDLYELVSGREVGGQPCVSVVNLKGSAGEGVLVGKCGASLGQGQSRSFAGASHGAVAEGGDGSTRVFFMAPDPTASGVGCKDKGVPPELYMRVDGEKTVEVSGPEPGGTAGYPAVYVGASEDGSKVFFLTRSELTKEAVALGTREPELYEYDSDAVEGKRLVRISGGKSGEVEGDVRDVPAVSGDGSMVYFNAEGELTPGAVGGLYRYDTDSGVTTYVAPIQEYPAEKPGTGRWYKEEVKLAEVAGLDVEADWYTTRSGQFLVFSSGEDVTGYDSGGQTELYRYSAEGEGGRIVCVSCNPNGVAPAAGSEFASEFARSAVSGDNPAGRPPRAISEESSNGPDDGKNNGSYVFFDTAESLVPQATNGKLDVYEWHEEPASPHKRTISLIGSGEGSANSFFLDSSENGSNVFFGTHAQLVPQDTDSDGDLYDARICEPLNGNPCIAPEHEINVQCEGDACQNPLPAPVDSTPASLTFSGAGNVPVQAAPESKGKPKPKPKKKPKKSKGKAKGKGKAKAKGKGRAKRARAGRPGGSAGARRSLGRRVGA
jgi:hypothetical protein